MFWFNLHKKSIFKTVFLSLLLIGIIWQINLKIFSQVVDPVNINLEYTNSKNSSFLAGEKELLIKQALVRKISKENLTDRNFELTNITFQNPSVAIVSLSNLTLKDIIHTDHETETVETAKNIYYFNVFLLENQGKWTAKLDSEDKTKNLQSLSSPISPQQSDILANISNKPVQTTGINRYGGYKFPWRAGEGWRTELVWNNAPWGWHTDHVSWALDFLPPAGSSLDLLASSDGIVEWICTTDNGRNQAGVHIRTVVGGVDYGESLRYYHIRKDMLAVGYQWVSQGQYLGKIKDGGNNGYPGCNLWSYNTHVHLGFSGQWFQIQDVLFDSALSQGNCLLYSTQNLPNIPIKQNYILKKTIRNFNSGPCNSHDLSVYNQNNVPAKFQIRIAGKISSDSYILNPQSNINIPMEALSGDIEIYTEGEMDLIATTFDPRNYYLKNRPIDTTTDIKISQSASISSQNSSYSSSQNTVNLAQAETKSVANPSTTNSSQKSVTSSAILTNSKASTSNSEKSSSASSQTSNTEGELKQTLWIIGIISLVLVGIFIYFKVKV